MAPAMRERSPNRWEVIVEAGRDPGTGRSRQVTRTFYGYRLVDERSIRTILGEVAVTKLNTKMLTDLYGGHQARGWRHASAHQIHACLSLMFTQACRWGSGDTNRRSGRSHRFRTWHRSRRRRTRSGR